MAQQIGFLHFHPVDAPQGEFDRLDLTEGDRAAGWTRLPVFLAEEDSKAADVENGPWAPEGWYCGDKALRAQYVMLLFESALSIGDAAPLDTLMELADDAGRAFVVEQVKRMHDWRQRADDVPF